MPTATTHRWQFTRSGGFDQARLDRAEDLKNLEHLDQKLWAALACPVKGLEFDERTLTLVDTDGDGRVRAPEILAAVQWCEDHLRDLAALKGGADSLPLASIRDDNASGKSLLASARQILKDLGKGDAKAISLADVADTAKIFAQTRFNGDGIIPEDAATDPAHRAVITDVIACLGSLPDRSAKPGIDQAKLDQFFAECETFSAWSAQAEADAALRPFGNESAVALDAWRAVRAKVEDYFTRCRLAAFDDRAAVAMNRTADDLAALAPKDLSAASPDIAAFPLARVEAGRALPLADGVNPAWAGPLAAFRTAVVVPSIGAQTTSLTAEQWAGLCAKLAPRDAWAAAKPATSVEKLGLPRVRELLAGGGKAAVTALVAEDKVLEKEAAEILSVERLVRYHRDLYRLLHNFVNLADFYSPDRDAVFQAGTLYLDARACELCVRVADPAKHAALAGLSKAYLAYCDLTRPSGEKMTIAAAFTGGDSDYLMVGRNGIFYDRSGRDWDATITRVVENPISVRQAFWSPYKKLVRLIDEQVAKRAAAAQSASDAKMAAAATATADVGKPAAPPPPEKKIDVGTVAALGVAFGAIGALITSLLGYATGLFQLPFWQISLAFVGLLLLISGPSMLIAWLKLRQRNLGPILDANGWAVNGRVRMNVKFGGSLTHVAKLPPGAAPAAADPYGEKPSIWPKLLGFIVALCFVWSFCDDHGWIYRWSNSLSEGKFVIGTRKKTDAEIAAEEEKAKKDAADKAAAEEAAKKPPAEPAPAPEKETPK